MRIATFNLESLDLAPGGEAALDRRIAVLAPLLDRLQADILCLQEVNAQKRQPTAVRNQEGPSKRGPTALWRLLAATGYAGCHLITSSGPDGDGMADVHNLAIVSRFPALEIRELRNDLVPAPAYQAVTAEPREAGQLALAWDRPLLYALLALPDGRRLHVINLHLRSPLAAAIPGQKTAPLIWSTTAGWAEGCLAATIKRSGQALEARLLVDSLFDADPEALIAICGDLNAAMEETPGRILRATVEDSGNPELASRVLYALEEKLPPERRFSVIHGGRPLLLDHILVSPALKAAYRSVEALNDGLPDEQAMTPDDPRSNHAPLVAGFDL